MFKKYNGGFMKRFSQLVTVFILILSTSVIAADFAFDKGAVRVGGSLFFQRETGEAYNDVSILVISPSTSFALSKSFFFGINTYIENYDYSYGSSITNWSVGPIIELYFPKKDQSERITQSVIPYFRLFLTKGENDGNNFRYIGVNIGLIKMFNEHIGLDFGISYSVDKVEVIIYDYDGYGNYYTYKYSDKNGKRLMVGFGIESFIF